MDWKVKENHEWYETVVYSDREKVSSFLVACTRLYMSLCRSVRWLVRRSVGPSEITLLRFFGVLSWKEVRFELHPLPNYHTAPVHPHATDAVVYTDLFSSNLISLIQETTIRENRSKFSLFINDVGWIGTDGVNWDVELMMITVTMSV